MRPVNPVRIADLRNNDAGTSLLEMALCSSMVLLVILGIMECSLAVYTEHYVESAAASGARYATVRGATYTGTSCGSTSSYYCEAGTTDVQNYVRANVAPAITSSKLSVTASWPGTSGGTGSAGLCYGVQGNDSPGCLVTVTVTYPFTFMLPAPFHKSITFRAVHSAVISQ